MKGFAIRVVLGLGDGAGGGEGEGIGGGGGIYVKLPKKSFIMSSARTLEKIKYEVGENWNSRHIALLTVTY